VKEFIDFLELRAHVLVDVGLRHLAEKVLVEVDQQLLTSLTHAAKLATNL